MASAGIALLRDPFPPSADVGEGFDARELDVNLKGARFTARIGLGFLRRGCGGGEEYCRWKECTGLVAYRASKHGAVGILRGTAFECC